MLKGGWKCGGSESNKFHQIFEKKIEFAIIRFGLRARWFAEIVIQITSRGLEKKCSMGVRPGLVVMGGD